MTAEVSNENLDELVAWVDKLSAASEHEIPRNLYRQIYHALSELRGARHAPETSRPLLLKALRELLDRYVGVANSGDAGNWDPEKEGEVVQARAALRLAPNTDFDADLKRYPLELSADEVLAEVAPRSDETGDVQSTVSVKVGIALLGKRVRKPKGQPLFVEGNVAICTAVRSNGLVDLVCRCCRQPAGIYSPLDLEQAP